jgi:aldehyde:ferredoxin oxidoreductase
LPDQLADASQDGLHLIPLRQQRVPFLHEAGVLGLHRLHPGGPRVELPDLLRHRGEAALELTVKMGTGQGCGQWLRHGSARAAQRVGKGSERFAVHVHGQEPPYHDPRFTSLMGVTYVADPTPGRHTAGGASWNETFGVGFPLPGAVEQREVNVSWHGTAGKGVAQAHFSNAHQVMNGLGLCMFTSLTGGLPWLDLVNALTGWNMTERELLACGERIQALRSAFNLREGLVPSDFAPHPRMFGEGDGLLEAGPLRGVTVPIDRLRRDYFAAMRWDPESGRLSRARAEELGIAELLAGHLAA